jgi:hypothetical protein
MYYYVADAGCYAYIVRVMKREKFFFLAEVLWFNRDGETFINSSLEEIPYNLFFNHWKPSDSSSRIPQ